MKELKHLNKYFYKYRAGCLLGSSLPPLQPCSELWYLPRLGIQWMPSVQILMGKFPWRHSNTSFFINILLILGAALLSGFLRFWCAKPSLSFQDSSNSIWRMKYFNNTSDCHSVLQAKPHRRFDEPHQWGCFKVRMYAGPALMYSTTTVTLFVVAISYMIYTAPILTLYAVAPLPILSISIYRLSVAIHKRSTVVQQYLSKLTTFTQESFSGISVIKAYGFWNPEPKYSLKSSPMAARTKTSTLLKCRRCFFSFDDLTDWGKQYHCGVCRRKTIYGWCHWIRYDRRVFDLCKHAYLAGGHCGMGIFHGATGWSFPKRINEFLKVTPEIKNHATTHREIVGKITFQNVSFTYPDTKIQALKGYHLLIKPGETLAIIGNTGSGKSTILELIGRLYDVTDGYYLIDDVPAIDHHLEDLRGLLAMFPGRILFSDTIQNNIKFGKGNATREEIIQAAKNAAVHKNIEGFQNGYETILGEREFLWVVGKSRGFQLLGPLLKTQNPPFRRLFKCGRYRNRGRNPTEPPSHFTK